VTKRLLHLTWDSPDNPWCGGGGAFRDYMLLERLTSWTREIWSGRHPRTSCAPTQTMRCDLGWGRFGEFVSRRTWAWVASRKLSCRLRGDAGLVACQSVSAWAPVWSSVDHPDRMLHVVHHVAGQAILDRLGPFGPSSYAYEQQILSKGRFYATPNRATASRIRDVNPGARIEIIPNGFSPPCGTFAPERFCPDSLVITFLGRLDHQMKGLDRLLEAFVEIGRRTSCTRLLLAGRSDACTDAWLARALADHPFKSRIDVVPNPSDQRKYALLDGSDIFCVPSRFEGWCIAAVEAQSRGLPVVATRTDGLLDSVLDGETGLLVSNEESRAPSALAEALLALVENETHRRELGANAVGWASRFTWEAAARSTEDLLEEIRHTLA
jgi:glycosyltransferase involved in cell wall biosynthesis